MQLGQSIIRKYLLLCAKCLMPLTFVGCVAPAVYLVDPLSESTVMEAEQGYVIARVVNAGNVAYPLNYLTIAPKNLNESSTIKPTRLSALNSTYGESTIFASPVVAGEYSLASIRSYHSNGERWYSRWINGEVSIGTFEVKPGVVTDLGTIIYYPKSQGDRYIETLLRSPGENNAKIVKSLLPFFQYEADESIGWNEDENDSDRHALYSSAVQNPVVYNRRYLAPDGSVYFIGKLGTIIKRTASAEWLLDAVDTDSDLVTVAQSLSGDLLVGGEQGALFAKRKGASWQSLSLDARYSVRDIRFYSAELADIIVVDSSQLRVLRGRLDQNIAEWKTMASYRPYAGWVDQYGNSQNIGKRKVGSSGLRRKIVKSASITEINGTHHLFMSEESGTEFSIFNHTRNFEYSYDPDTWLIKKSKGFDKGIDRVLNAGKAKLGIDEAGAWITWNTYLRFDDETNTWGKIATRIDRCPHIKSKHTGRCMIDGRERTRFKKFTFLSVPVFSTSNDAIAFVSVRKAPTGFMGTKPAESESVVVKTSNGGVSWQKTDIEIPGERCTNTVPEAEGVLLVSCFGSSSDLYQSDDGGKTWDHVREHENI